MGHTLHIDYGPTTKIRGWVYMSLTNRNRFYEKVILDSSNVSTVSDDWKTVGFKLNFPANLTTIVISNDSFNQGIEYSFDGRNLDGEMFSDDGPFAQDGTSEGYLYLRLPAGTVLGVDKVQVRIWSWRGGTGG